MQNCPNLYLTPIAKKDGEKYKSNRDYLLQVENSKKGLSMFWDGPPNTFKTPLKDDYFIFLHHKKCVKIHKILNVFDPICRLPSWSDNVGHSDRPVIELTAACETIQWDDYINNFDGYKRSMKTCRVSNERSKKIIDFLTQEF